MPLSLISIDWCGFVDRYRSLCRVYWRSFRVIGNLSFWLSARVIGVHPELLAFSLSYWRSTRVIGVRPELLAFTRFYWRSLDILAFSSFIWRSA
ncbi:hypothetical protein [Sporosarcina cyprini]|uniref:hypothetical protein n=1 Tax=Sporosarcina cyprini TaxID=2910523 RepID=UPI001EDCF53E|nr:hypothetical protein [Sporosarcina cyprini]MCG3089464.1 hypothetical protein [Sporosarcina cyprini]